VVTTSRCAAQNVSLHRKVKEFLAKEMEKFVASASHFAAQNMSLHRKVKEFFIQIQQDLWLRHHVLLRKT